MRELLRLISEQDRWVLSLRDLIRRGERGAATAAFSFSERDTVLRPFLRKGIVATAELRNRKLVRKLQENYNTEVEEMACLRKLGKRPTGYRRKKERPASCCQDYEIGRAHV